MTSKTKNFRTVTFAEVDDAIATAVGSVPPDTVRSNEEIEALISTALTMLPPDQVRTDAEINDLIIPQIMAAINALPEDQVRTDAEIISLILNITDNLPPPRTDAEVQALIDVAIAALPEDQVRTDDEINDLINPAILAAINALPADQVRTDAEILALILGITDNLTDDVRTDTEIQALIDATPDQTRSDAEIQALIDATPDLVRTDIEIQALIDATPDLVRTNAEIQAIIDATPDLVRSDSEIQALINNSLPTESLGYFVIWAEESADLNNNSFEWAYGNGNDTPSGTGIQLPFDCELVALGLSLEGNATCSVEARIGTGSAGKSVGTTNQRNALNNFEDDPVLYTQGSLFNFRTLQGSTASNGGVAAAWFKKRTPI